MFSSDEIIDLAIQIEINARKVYRQALDRTDGSDLVLLLNWLIEEETRHIEWFSALRNFVKKVPGDPKILDMGRAILAETIGDASFSLDSADFGEMARTKELLALAAEFEKDKIQFFGMLRPFIGDPETLGDLDVIIAEEKRHVAYLRQYIDADLIPDLF
jgi:rubrerythrin